ncbi:hypothetical protein C0991_003896 [Blastosporella zonata]|nr:hypothetical protein C0991_003896 [Blastosporella zonata]
MVAAMKQGSIIVDMAAEAGGNCEATRPGELHVHRGVTVIGERLWTTLSIQAFVLTSFAGYTDLPSRLPTQSSTLYSNNITKFLLSMGDNGSFGINLQDEVIRGSIVIHEGEILSPMPRVMPAPASPPPTPIKAETAVAAITPWQKASREVAVVTAGMGSVVALGKATGTAFMDSFFTFGLAGATDPPEYTWLYGVPAVIFTGGFLAAASTGMAGLVQAGYLTSSMLCIGSLSGLASQTTARQGNALGLLGVSSGILASLAAVGFPPAVIAQFAGVAGIGGAIGAIIGRRVTATELPQTVAMLHSIVGLSAVMTSIGSVLADTAHLSNLHIVTAYLGVVIGGITFTGSIVAFLKLAAKMSSKPLALPGKHIINSSLLGANALTLAGFLAMAPTTPVVAASFLGTSAVLSFIKGYTTTAAIGGADMPVVITVLNAYSSVLLPVYSIETILMYTMIISGFALVAEGFMLDNPLLTTIGSLIGVSGSILSYIMCVAMNRSLTNVLFGGIAPTPSTETHEIKGTITKTTVDETVEALANADSVILVVGYGMAVAKAQYAISEIAAMLRAKGVNVRAKMDEINDDFKDTDVTLVIGANDTVNPIALEPGSAIAGMPVLHAWKSKQVVVMKRGLASGYADVPNPMFYMHGTKMLFGDAKDTCDAIKRGLEAHLKD